MPIMNSWKDEAKTILYVEFLDNWTWEDYHAASSEARRMVTEIEHHFVQLLDLRKSKPIPTANSPVSQIMRGRKSESEKQGITVIVGAEALVKIIIKVFEESTGSRYQKRYLVESIEEALDVIANYFAERESLE